MGIELILWIKIIHIIAVISWMAGLLYLPRLFVYHSEKTSEEQLNATFKVMEYRLFRFIMSPAMMVVWITGLALLKILMKIIISFPQNSFVLLMKCQLL